MSDFIKELSLLIINLLLIATVPYLIRLNTKKVSKDDFEEFKNETKAHIQKIEDKFENSLNQIKEFSASIDKNLAVLAEQVKAINQRST